MKGMVFDISECSLYDGPGMRMAVFFKGCPLRCKWCHSPEGQSAQSEILRFPDLPDRVCGREWSADQLADHINGLTEILPEKRVTFTGGEPLMQKEFLSEVLDKLAPDTDVLVESSGYCEPNDFLDIANRVSYIYFGVKLLEEQESVCWTGKGCRKVLENLTLLDSESTTPYSLRIPFLHGITDRREYLLQLADFCGKLKRLEKIIFLPSNRDAAAKYLPCGRSFTSEYDPEYLCVLPADIEFSIPVEILRRDEV